MDFLPIFMNERSFDSTAESSEQDCRASVLALLAVLKLVKAMRPDTALIAPASIGLLQLGAGRYSFASLLRGRHSDEWRFIKSLIERSLSFEEYVLDTEKELFTVLGGPAVGLSHARKRGCLAASLPTEELWREPEIKCHLSSTIQQDQVEITIKNVSLDSHVTIHSEIIREYGHMLSSSSVIREFEDCEVRMFVNDHPPPHFHVMSVSGQKRTLARYVVGSVDILSGELSGQTRREVEEWARSNATALHENWLRCENDEHPIPIA